MVKKIKKYIRKIIFPNTYSSDRYIAYLREKGVSIGENCYIWSPNHTIIDVQNPEMLSIGDYCKITKGVTILSHDYSMSVVRRKYHRHIGYVAKTTIGNNVFIGMNAIILMGTQIGDNCIIGAGAVVNGRFDDNVVIAGNPARVICTLEEYYKRHLGKEYECAKEYFLVFKEKHKRIPSVEEMGNAFAWLYLPRTDDSLKKYDNFFRLSGDNYNEIKQDFICSKGGFCSYEEFIKNIDNGSENN